MSGQQPTDVVSANFNQSTAAAHVVVAGVTGKRIVVVGAFLQPTAACAITIEDSDGTNAIGPCPSGANGGFVLPRDFDGWAVLPSGKGLSVLLGTATQTGGCVLYRWING
jgi:hypothetical protein